MFPENKQTNKQVIFGGEKCQMIQCQHVGMLMLKGPIVAPRTLFFEIKMGVCAEPPHAPA